MPNAQGDHIDTTYLTVTQTTERGYFHRDYQAHCIKYSHLVKFIREQRYWKQPWILDIGCGKETPLARPLAARQQVRAEHVGYYVGTDYGPIDRRWLSEESTFPAEFLPHTDFADVDWPDEFHNAFHILNCQEVLEHVEPQHAYRMLLKMREYIHPEGRAFISTPIYNGQAANNHVCEYSYFGFQTLMELAGFEVEHVQGTFASMKDYKAHMNEHCQWVFEKLKGWFEAEILAVTMGPLIEPHLARNALWRMVKSTPITMDEETWEYLAQPEHGSSEEWTPFIQSLMPKKSKKPRQLKGG